ncbi:MAG TPA: oxidoreductase [Anaeromyxobacter sp.]|nr:oxidoreductase [Anaeromyxobacter sp.]
MAEPHPIEDARPIRTAVPPQGEAVRTEVPRRRIKDLEVMVAEVIPETSDTATLVLFTGNDRLEYQPGHFLTIDPHQFEALERWVAYLEDAKGRREAPRAYSLASAPHERHLAITIKEERYQGGVTRYPPLLSPMLVKRTVRGSRLWITGFTGPYVLPPDVEGKTDHLVHLVAGSGVVPNWSILKHSLRAHPRLRHTVIDSNKTWRDVIYREALGALAAEHPDRLRVVHTLTREPEPERLGPDVRGGRIGADLLRELIPDPRAALVYACGPAIGPWERLAAREQGEAPRPRFLEAALAALLEAGVPKDRVRQESYG